MSHSNSLTLLPPTPPTLHYLPFHLIYKILDFLPLQTVSTIKTASQKTNTYFQSRLYKQINYFHQKLHTSKLPKSFSSIKIISPLPLHFVPNVHIIYHLLHQFERPTHFFRMISPTTLYQHLLPRYTTLSGVVPFIKVPTAMGFYKLISIYPYTENPEMFVVDYIGGMSSRDREFNIQLYYTKTLNSYKKPLTFEELFPKLLPFITD